MGQKIVSKPSTKEFRDNYPRIFRKRVREPEKEDENVDWGDFKTDVCCTDDPHFGG